MRKRKLNKKEPPRLEIKEKIKKPIKQIYKKLKTSKLEFKKKMFNELL